MYCFELAKLAIEELDRCISPLNESVTFISVVTVNKLFNLQRSAYLSALVLYLMYGAALNLTEQRFWCQHSSLCSRMSPSSDVARPSISERVVSSPFLRALTLLFPRRDNLTDFPPRISVHYICFHSSLLKIQGF